MGAFRELIGGGPSSQLPLIDRDPNPTPKPPDLQTQLKTFYLFCLKAKKQRAPDPRSTPVIGERTEKKEGGGRRDRGRVEVRSHP